MEEETKRVVFGLLSGGIGGSVAGIIGGIFGMTLARLILLAAILTGVVFIIKIYLLGR